MKVFDSEEIRNVAVVGHGDTGKTSLVSALLFSSGAINRLGKVDDGNTVTDYDEEEIERKVTISTGLAHCEHKKTKINLLDTPGYGAFLLDAKGPLLASEAALVVVDAASGVEVQTETVWGFADEFGIPKAIFINKIDRERASFNRSLDSLQKTFGRGVTAVQLPIGKEKDFKGFVDLIKNKAFVYEMDGSGKFSEEDIPADMADDVSTRREELVEMVAESDDKLLEKFFEEGTLSDEELVAGLKKSFRKGDLNPVFAGAALPNCGAHQLLDYLVDLFPNPLERPPLKVVEGKEERDFQPTRDKPTSAMVFKTLADPFAGHISMIKVFSGTLKAESSVKNLSKDHDERLASVQIAQGKQYESVPEVHAGDICVVTKLKETTTGDTLGDKNFKGTFKKVEYPEPAISFAIEPKSRGDEDKIGNAVARIIEEDPSVSFRRDEETGDFLLSGTGQIHVEVVVNKLKKKYGVEVLLKTPKVPYRETITAEADVQGRHKKQTGGHGQFGDCYIKMRPRERDAGFKFTDSIFGGSIPRQFIPAVEKGVVESAARGYLAGYPVVDFEVEVYDGSYHSVDSSEMAFKIAANIAFKKAMEQARPVLLEPIMNVEIYVPEDSAGDVMGDLNSRRGRIQGMDVKGTSQVIKAQVPLAEMLTYAPALTSMTGGRGSFHMEQAHYDIVPHNIAEKIIAER
ncbi:MAG TPA: elongation factor G, partial [Acidobacteriota bacterium]|nr:elongation factor G [Acidobacteriota bacterium]